MGLNFLWSKSKWLLSARAVWSFPLMAMLFACAEPSQVPQPKSERFPGPAILKFVIPSNPPSADGHRETTYGTIHPFAPFYSLLIRINPDNPASPTDFKCDLCVGNVPKPTKGGKKFTFKIRQDVKFHDGSKLAAHDIVATFNKIIWPPAGVWSARKKFFLMVDEVTAPDDHTVVFDLEHPSGAFIPALAMPYNFVYAKKILDSDMHWYESHVMGSGPFKFMEWQRGAFIKGVRNPDYYHKGKPRLDGFHATFERKYSANLRALRSGRAYIQFRGFAPRMRDDLKRALGDKLTVQENDWNCFLMVTPNHEVKPFNDARVRRALTLAIDRWGGSEYLSRIAIVKTVGGMVFPGHPLAATKAELQEIAGYWPDIEKSRAEARRLLTEAGYPNGFSFEFHNRGVDQPYKIIGTWLVDQWRRIGLKVKQRIQPSSSFYATLREIKDFEVSMDFNCQSIVNPLLDVSKFQSDTLAGNQYAGYQDRIIDKLYAQMNQSGDPVEQRRIMRKYEKRALDEQAHMFPIMWWNRIILHHAFVRGWKIGPSHYLNQDLSGIWLERNTP